MKFSSLYGKSAKQSDSYVWIGLDFGTATTECVLRVEKRGAKDEVYVLNAESRSTGQPQIIIPSAVEVTDSWIRTGVSLVGQGRSLDELKLQVISESTERLPHAELFRLQGPCFYIVLHLAVVIGMARKAIEQKLGGSPRNYYLNVAAPIGVDSQNEAHARLKLIMHEVAYRALQLSKKVPHDKLKSKEAEILFRDCMKEPLPAIQNSPVTVVPEALAAVTAFLQIPGRANGNYATIDIGGGSTDVSFFWFHGGQYDGTQLPEACYYSIRTEHFGMSSILSCLESGISMYQGRTRHERLGKIPAIEKYADRPPVRQLLQNISLVYKNAFIDSFKLLPDYGKWVDQKVGCWDLLFLGGGCSDTYIRDYLESNCPDARMDAHRSCESLGSPHDLELLAIAGESTITSKRSLHKGPASTLPYVAHFLTVAYGLSIRAPDIPRYDQHEFIGRVRRPKDWEPPPHSVYT